MVYNLAVFTGLIQAVGRLQDVRSQSQQKTLRIVAELSQRDLELGASVAVSGVCLTVTQSGPGWFEAQAAFETLRKTTLGDRKAGDGVNIEPSLRVGDPLGGHLVSGHVDGIATIRSVQPRGDARELWIDVPPDLRRFIAPKGSVAADGVSLTVNDVDDTGFMVGLIPHTLDHTTLGQLDRGAPVNLEVDVLARYVARIVELGHGHDEKRSTLTKETLRAMGFVGREEER